jgi:hypothetical protein
VELVLAIVAQPIGDQPLRVSRESCRTEGRGLRLAPAVGMLVLIGSVAGGRSAELRRGRCDAVAKNRGTRSRSSEPDESGDQLRPNLRPAG